MIFLQEMLARAELDEPAIIQPAGEIFGQVGCDLGAGISAKEEFWIDGSGERRVSALEGCIDVSRLPGDRQFVWKAPSRPSRLRRRERSTVDGHLLVGQFSQHPAWQDLLDESVAVQDQFLSFP